MEGNTQPANYAEDCKQGTPAQHLGKTTLWRVGTSPFAIHTPACELSEIKQFWDLLCLDKKQSVLNETHTPSPLCSSRNFFTFSKVNVFRIRASKQMRTIQNSGLSPPPPPPSPLRFVLVVSRTILRAVRSEWWKLKVHLTSRILSVG